MCRNEELDPENDDVITTRVSRECTMFVIFRELFFIFAIAFTAYATINSHKTKRGTPVPFFEDENIKDFYKGDLVELMRDVTFSDFSLVMYYAPWDADSQDVKTEFSEAAEFYSNKVYFAAVNCWEPGSECRNSFKNIVIDFPRIAAYIGPHRAIELKGQKTSDDIIKFLTSIISPVTRLDYVAELWRLRYLHDAVLVGHLNFDGLRGALGYDILYEVALHLATHDHQRHTAVAVFTNTKHNENLGITKSPSIALYLWNRKYIYNGPLTVRAVLKWAVSHIEEGFGVLNSNTILPHLNDGAVMVMFTPRHPLSNIIPYYLLLRRIAMNFNHCSNRTEQSEDHFFTYVLQHGSPSFEDEFIKQESKMRKECSKYKTQRAQNTCMMPSVSKYDNMSCYRSLPYCPSMKLKYSKEFNQKSKKYGTPQEILESAKKHRCALLERTPLPLIPNASLEFKQRPSSCEINKTLSFIALDSDQYDHLANALGIQLKNMRHKTSVVIFDNEEILKIKSPQVNDVTVTNLLKRYISGERERSLRSVKDTVNFHNSAKDKQNGNIFSIVELNSISFHKAVLDNAKNVVVLYHSAYCSFCLGVSNIFLYLAYLLRNVENILIARIDGELNDLPWQFTVHTYPSILFFPAKRKSESRLFPQNKELNLHSLSSFIVSNLKIPERVQVMLALCSRWGQDLSESLDGEYCLKNVRENSLDGISKTLKEYRSILIRLKYANSVVLQQSLRKRQQQLLKRLEYLKLSSLNLVRISDVQNSIILLNNLKSQII